MRQVYPLLFLLISFLCGASLASAADNLSTAYKPAAEKPELKSKEEKTREAVERELLKFSGYYKNIYTASKTISTKEDYFADIQRLRLSLETKFTDALSALLSYDNEIIINDFSKNSDFGIIREKDQKKLAFWDADKTISDQKHTYWKHSLYRGYLKYAAPALQYTLGKQAIDWSRMKLYQPFDLFNPASPLDLEQDEKIGVDALNLEFYPEAFSSVNFIFAPQKKFEKQGLGIKLAKKIKDYDVSLIMAELNKDEIAGIGFDGYLKEAGLRGELTFTHKDNEKEFFRAAVGLDHNFSPKIYAITEYFYNGGAEKDSAQFLNSYQFSRQALTMKKHILGTGIEYELSGVLKLTNYVFYDFAGKSVFLNPEIRYNIFTNLDFILGAQDYWGDKNSEFGNYENVYYAQAKWFF